MTEDKYTSTRIIDGKPRKIIVWVFYDINRRPPTIRDFCNGEYPGKSTYIRFGSWHKQIAGLDFDSLIEKGMVTDSNKNNNSSLRGRIFEMIIYRSFNNESKDISGKNCISPFDGICPKGFKYDAKSSRFDPYTKRWHYNFLNKYIGEIDYFFLVDEKFEKLLHVWLIPKSLLNGKNFKNIPIHEIDKMEEFEVTNKCINLFNF